jgi:glycosyltransferase involved in cell wall biosynthesis
MKILIVNYFYPPVIDAHSYRWEQIAKYWVKSGHHVEVITGTVHDMPVSSIESGVHVSRVGVFAKKKSTTYVSNRAPSPLSGVNRRILNSLRPLYRKLYWPDSAWHWIPSVTLEVIKRRKNDYDLVISYYPCFAAHVGVAILRFFKKKSGFTWIADYGDPFSTSPTMQPNNYAIYDGLNKWAEKKLADMANFLVFTNDATANAYKHSLNLNDKIFVIPHLANIEDHYSIIDIPSNNENNIVTLCYIGGFHKKIREPSRLFNIIKLLNQLDEKTYILKIYGPLNGFSIDELSPIDCIEIQYMGPVKRDDAVGLLRNADAIVNVDNDNCIMTPSKVVECISTGCPIVNISSDNVNYAPLQKYIELGYAITVTDEDISRKNAVDVANFIYSHRTRGVASLDSIERVLKSHSLESIANQYCLLRFSHLEESKVKKI